MYKRIIKTKYGKFRVKKMITISYSDNIKGEPVIFEFLFPIKEYIPAKYFELTEIECPTLLMRLANILPPIEPELYFYIDLLGQSKLLVSYIGTPHIWTINYTGNYKGIIFKMIYDEDYSFIHFAVSDPDKRQELAEYIKYLIESQRMI